MPVQLSIVVKPLSASCAVALASLLAACGVASDHESSHCDHVIVEIQNAPIPIFLGVCSERAASLPNLSSLLANTSSAEDVLTRIEGRNLQEGVGPLAVLVAGAEPSTGRTKNGPRFCLLGGEGVQLLVLRAEDCPGKSESQKILETASRLAQQMSWRLLERGEKARFRDALLQRLEGLPADVEDVRLLGYNLTEPVP